MNQLSRQCEILNISQTISYHGLFWDNFILHFTLESFVLTDSHRQSDEQNDRLTAKLLLAFTTVVILGSKSHRTQDQMHIS
jgi:hypothetical protein